MMPEMLKNSLMKHDVSYHFYRTNVAEAYPRELKVIIHNIELLYCTLFAQYVLIYCQFSHPKIT